MLGFLPTRAYRPATPGATTFLSPLSGTFNYGWDSFPTFVDTYSTAELERASRTYHDNLVGSWEEDLLPRLTPAQRGAASTVSLRLPLIGAGRNPYDFYASPTARVVTIPILSVKFLDDLATEPVNDNGTLYGIN